MMAGKAVADVIEQVIVRLDAPIIYRTGGPFYSYLEVVGGDMLALDAFDRIKEIERKHEHVKPMQFRKEFSNGRTDLYVSKMFYPQGEFYHIMQEINTSARPLSHVIPFVERVSFDYRDSNAGAIINVRMTITNGVEARTQIGCNMDISSDLCKEHRINVPAYISVKVLEGCFRELSKCNTWMGSEPSIAMEAWRHGISRALRYYDVKQMSLPPKQ